MQILNLNFANEIPKSHNYEIIRGGSEHIQMMQTLHHFRSTSFGQVINLTNSYTPRLLTSVNLYGVEYLFQQCEHDRDQNRCEFCKQFAYTWQLEGSYTFSRSSQTKSDNTLQSSYRCRQTMPRYCGHSVACIRRKSSIQFTRSEIKVSFTMYRQSYFNIIENIELTV